jgi:methenyltetrahydromethanopterin cyclohydrolase
MSSLKVPSKLLVIAQSARMLAQIAVDAGFMPVVIDCFADSDTRQLALHTLKVSSLKLADVQPALEAVRKAYGLTHLVYGSGFEQCGETLAFLEEDWIVLGNSAEIFRRFQDKPAFFGRLADLSIPFPETVFAPPTDGGNWLVKPMRGEGGCGISRYNPDAGSTLGECYWQRVLEGKAFSISFVAGCSQAKVLGYNRQWSAAIDDEHPFMFAGVCSHAEVSLVHQSQLSEWLTKLVEDFSLSGLGSLDFIVENDRCYVLEINARIPASAQLYGKSVFTLHLQACLESLEGTSVEQVLPAAYRIIYAKSPIKIPEDVDWPKWAADRPDGGAFIGKGQPICSIIAAGKSPRQLSKRLRRRQLIIENILNTGS